METKYIMIEFVHPGIRAKDRLYDISEAVEKASVNLKQRHGIIIKPPSLSGNLVYLTVIIPDGIEFSYNRLRGIGAYLLKYHQDAYMKYRVGTRLFLYRLYEPDFENKETIISLHKDRCLDYLAEFTNLLRRSDKEAFDKVARIVDILEQNKGGDLDGR